MPLKVSMCAKIGKYMSTFVSFFKNEEVFQFALKNKKKLQKISSILLGGISERFQYLYTLEQSIHNRLKLIRLQI